MPGGSFLAEFLHDPLQERRSQWEDMVAHGLQKLEEKFDDFRREQLKQNEVFVTAVTQATQIALRNHDPIKRRALRNAVLNVACGTTLDEDRQLMFLNWIDSLAGLHLRLLKLFANPEKKVDLGGISMGGLSAVVERGIPELAGQRDFYDQLWRDLRNRGLVSTDSLHGMMSRSGMLAKRTTALGDEFLRFVVSPVDD
ncbi:MAG: hypothetical protein ACOY3L_00130 [Pseudomonadota bacterium]